LAEKSSSEAAEAAVKLNREGFIHPKKYYLCFAVLE